MYGLLLLLLVPVFLVLLVGGGGCLCYYNFLFCLPALLVASMLLACLGFLFVLFA